MNVNQALSLIKKASDPRARESWKKMKISPEKYLGANLTSLKKIATKIKKDHTLALALWKTKIHDAKLLSTMIEEPKKVTEDQIDTQIKQIYSVDLADKYVEHIAVNMPFAKRKLREWIHHNKQYHKRAGFILVSRLAKAKQLSEAECEVYLAHIRKEIAGERNWVKEAMLYATISLGQVNEDLRKLAVHYTKDVGKITIDYGDTSCKAPNPLTALAKIPKKKPTKQAKKKPPLSKKTKKKTNKKKVIAKKSKAVSQKKTKPQKRKSKEKKTKKKK